MSKIEEMNGFKVATESATKTSIVKAPGTNKCSSNLTSAQGLELDTPSPQFSLKNSISSDSAKKTNTAETSLENDTQEFQSLQMSIDTTGQGEISTVPVAMLTSLQPALPANHFLSKGSDLEPTTGEIASQELSTQSTQSGQNFSASKTSPDSLAVPTSPDTQAVTLAGLPQNFPNAGLMLNGSVLRADTLAAPSLDDGCFWLESPGALSSTGSGRPPGQSKLEAQLRPPGAIALQEVVDPIFLEDSFSIPQGWSDPSECRAATELFANKGKPLETALTPESPRSHSEESFTSIPLPKMLCTIKQPGQPELTGTIAQDLGSEFSIRIEGSEQSVTVPKLYVFPGSQKSQSPEPTWKESDRAYYQDQCCTILVPVGKGKYTNKTKIATAEDFEGFWVPTVELAAVASNEPNSKPRCAAPIDQVNDLSILDAAQSQLEEQIAKFKTKGKKAATIKQCQGQIENILALRTVVEKDQPLVGMWITKQISDFNCVGQIVETGKGEQSTWVQWWGNPTPYPEQLSILAWDEFAQTTTLKPSGKIRIIPGHKTLKPGTLFQVRDLHANGWVLTTDDQLISSKYWEVADDESQSQPTDASCSEIPEPAEDIPATEAGSPTQDLLLEDLPRDSDFSGEGQIQLQDESVQEDLEDAGTRGRGDTGTEEESDLVYRQLIQMGMPPAQARYLASQGVD